MLYPVALLHTSIVEAKSIHCLLICDDRSKPNTFPNFWVVLFLFYFYKFIFNFYLFYFIIFNFYSYFYWLPWMYPYSSSIENNSSLFPTHLYMLQQSSHLSLLTNNTSVILICLRCIGAFLLGQATCRRHWISRSMWGEWRKIISRAYSRKIHQSLYYNSHICMFLTFWV